MTTTADQVLDLGRRWAEAEAAGDAIALDAMTTPDFTLVGPLGFVLDKQQWLDRYRGGDLVTRSADWHDASVRDYGAAAVAIGIHNLRAEYQGRPTEGRFRVTQIFVRDGERWALAGVQLSPIAGAR
jgi:ketosteroid isomerase-like protein